jgi:hypothetical protein
MTNIDIDSNPNKAAKWYMNHYKDEIDNIPGLKKLLKRYMDIAYESVDEEIKEYYKRLIIFLAYPESQTEYDCQYIHVQGGIIEDILTKEDIAHCSQNDINDYNIKMATLRAIRYCDDDHCNIKSDNHSSRSIINDISNKYKDIFKIKNIRNYDWRINFINKYRQSKDAKKWHL